MKSDAVAQKAYCPHGGADMLWRCRSPEILYDGPANTGKSRAALEKANLAALKYPGARILLCRKTRASMTQSVLVTFESKVCPPWPWVSNVKRSHRESYSYPNGSEVVIGGMDKPTRILSTEYDMIIAHQAEEFTEDEWELLTSRLRNHVMPYQQGIAECNPGPPKHWLKRRADEKRMRRILSRHSDNPAITEEDLARLKALTGHRRERLYKGKWVSASGLVYETFDEACHVKRIRRPWQRFLIGIDDGYTNPLSAHLYLIDGDGRIHSRYEFYKTQQLPEDVLKWAKRMRRIVKIAAGEEIEAVVIDPSAAKLRAAFDKAGFAVVAADNTREGLKTVEEYLRKNGDDLPRLTFDPSCRNQIQEFGMYEWAKNAAGQSKDVPRKQDDHAMDDLRYTVRHCERTSGSMEVISL